MTLTFCNLHRLPGPLRGSFQQRFASTSSFSSSSSSSASSSPHHHHFAFPLHPNPTPHEIFHLPRGASQSQIKARYYELVRIHHPDCTNARGLPPTTSHDRFQAISNAYAVLSGKNLASSSNPLDHNDVPYHEEVLRRKRAQWRAAAGSDEFGQSGPSMWELQEREKLDQAALIFIIALALTVSVLPLSLLSPFVTGRQRHEEAAKNLADARREAKDVSEIRRLAVLRRQYNFDTSNREKVELEGER